MRQAYITDNEQHLQKVREEPLGDEGQKSFAVLWPVEDESLDDFVQLRLWEDLFYSGY